MAWKDSLLDASFRGVPFDMISVSDNETGSLAEHSYPFVNGVRITPMGDGPHRMTVRAIFFGDDYETRLEEFLLALRVRGAGELVHPVFGPMQVCVGERTTEHNADAIDTASVTVAFVEDSLSLALFSGRTSSQVGDAASASAYLGLQASAAQLSDRISGLSAKAGQLSVLNRINGLRDRMNAVLGAARSTAHGVITSGLDVISAPEAFASDIAACANNLIDLRSFDPSVMMAQWRSLKTQLGNILRLPDDHKTRTPDQVADDRALGLFVGVQLASSMVDAATAVLAVDATTPTLTPAEIEELGNAARTQIQACIDGHRAFYALPEARAVTESLKNAAQQVQLACESVLALSPPLIVRTVDSACSLRLLAFRWYGDNARAVELLRLNPGLARPNLLLPGDTLNAYAR